MHNSVYGDPERTILFMSLRFILMPKATTAKSIFTMPSLLGKTRLNHIFVEIGSTEIIHPKKPVADLITSRWEVKEQHILQNKQIRFLLLRSGGVVLYLE